MLGLFHFRWAMMLSLGVVLMAVACVEGAVVGSPMSTFVDPGQSIALSASDPTWSADLSTYQTWLGDLHALIGSSGAGQADVQYTSEGAGVLGPGVAAVGYGADWRTGILIYRFTLPDGLLTGAGGTVTAHAMLSGTPSTQGQNVWLGVSSAFAPSAGPVYSILENPEDFAKAHIDNSSDYGAHVADLSLAIPEGVGEFYVAIADVGSSARFRYDTLKVGTVIAPEPHSLALLGLGVMGVVCRRRR